MSHEKNTSGSTGSDTYEGYEKEDVNVLYIVGFAFICMVTVTVCIVGLNGLLIYMKEELKNQVNTVDTRALNQLRAEEKELLTTYDIVDEEAKVYRIPITRAMKLISEESLVTNLDQGQSK